MAGGHAAAVRFDGENDYLRQGAGVREFDRFTVVVAAAPRANPGGFRALFSAAETGKNDYITGLNLDLGPFGSAAFDVLNVEGRGFGGFRNLSNAARPFRQLHVVTVAGDGDAVRSYFNGEAAGRRERAAGRVRWDELYVGARRYSNDATPPFVSGFLDGDVAEVLLYDRALTSDELRAVNAYETRKHASYAQELSRTGGEGEGEVLRPVENPPDVQVFVPGFSVRPLPVDLTNINNVRYREDGKLVALAYDGNVYVLSDTDGDGLEDRADLFWDNRGRIVSPVGMALTPPGYKAGRGLFVASKGKVSLILDTDGDGRAERRSWSPKAGHRSRTRWTPWASRWGRTAASTSGWARPTSPMRTSPTPPGRRTTT